MRSTDHGRSWEELGTRRPGRYQSLSYRGSEFGLVVYEMRTSNKRDSTDTLAIYVERVDGNFTRVSTVTYEAPKSMYDFYDCYSGEDAATCNIVSLGSAGALLTVVRPCTHSISQEPDPPMYRSLLYRSRRPEGEFEIVTTLPYCMINPVRRYRPKLTKEAVFGDSMFTGLLLYVTFDNGLSWGDVMCRVKRPCHDVSDPLYPLYLWGVSSGLKNGAVLESWGDLSCPNIEDLRMRTFYKVWPRTCSILTVDSIMFQWPFRGLAEADYSLGKHIQYGLDGLLYSSYYSCYLTPERTSAIDTLFLFVRKPTTATFTPNSHAIDREFPTIRVAGSMISVRTTRSVGKYEMLFITDATGRIIRSHAIATENEEIYIGDLPRGMYYAYMPGVKAMAVCNL